MAVRTRARDRPATDGGHGEPLPRAHAHDDYEHDRPLLDALEHGFTSVEADVWLVDGELRVAHDAWEVDDAPTLEEAYLEPLSELVSANGKEVHPGHDGIFQLLIDIKSDGPETWAAVEAELAEHRRFITRYHRGRTTDRAVEAVISGNRPLADMQDAETRYSFYDGRSTDLGTGLAPEPMPLVSENWTKLFTWQGVGEMPAAERERLQAYVEQAHEEGYLVRFWATDDLAGLQEFLSR